MKDFYAPMCLISERRLRDELFFSKRRFTIGIAAALCLVLSISDMEKEIEVNCNINAGGIKINKLSVFPIGVSLIGTGNIADNTNDINVSVKTKNGSVLDLEYAVSQNDEDKFLSKYMPLEPIKVIDIKEVIINGKIVKIT